MISTAKRMIKLEAQKLP